MYAEPLDRPLDLDGWSPAALAVKLDSLLDRQDLHEEQSAERAENDRRIALSLTLHYEQLCQRLADALYEGQEVYVLIDRSERPRALHLRRQGGRLTVDLIPVLQPYHLDWIKPKDCDTQVQRTAPLAKTDEAKPPALVKHFVPRGGPPNDVSDDDHLAN